MSLLYMGTTCSFAAVLVWFDEQNYTVTEGGTVNITLVTNTTDYEFDFSVSLLETMNGSATGQLLIYTYLSNYYHLIFAMYNFV